MDSRDVPRLVSKLKVFTDLTTSLASLSTCKRPGSNLGCVVIPQDMSEVVAIGYNGPAAGEGPSCCKGQDAVGSCGCIHAEANAVAKMHTRQTGLVMIATFSPCELCAGLVINTRRVDFFLYHSVYRDRSGLDRLDRAGITTCSVGAALGDWPKKVEGKTVVSEGSD